MKFQIARKTKKAAIAFLLAPCAVPAAWMLGACGSDANDPPRNFNDGGGDVSSLDDARGDAPPGETPDAGSRDSDVPDRAPIPITCGTGTVAANTLGGGGSIGIAYDGTIYNAYFSGNVMYIARTRPGQPQELEWLPREGHGVSDISPSPDGTKVFYIASTVDVHPYYHYQIEVVDPRSAVPSPRAVGAPFPARTDSPTSLAISPSGDLVVGGFFGIMRVHDDGERTPIVKDLGNGVDDVVHTGNAILANVHGAGVVRMKPDGSSLEVLHDTTERAFQDLGIDQQGRFYLTAFGRFGQPSTQERLVRFSPTFENEEVLYNHQIGGGSLSFKDFAFGKGALACDIYITGSSGLRVPIGNTPGFP